MEDRLKDMNKSEIDLFTLFKSIFPTHWFVTPTCNETCAFYSIT